MLNFKTHSKPQTAFYRQIRRLVIPIVIQNLLSAAVNSADVVMLNYVGQSSISAVSLASQYASVLFMVYYGLGTGATMLCAQYYGCLLYTSFPLDRVLRISLFLPSIIACPVVFDQ